MTTAPAVDRRTALDYFGLSSMPRVVRVPSAMTVRDVADYLNVDEKTVYRLAQRGALPGFKVAGTWRFRRDDIDGWIEKQKALAAGRAVPSREHPRR